MRHELVCCLMASRDVTALQPEASRACIQVIHCDTWEMSDMKQDRFFKDYQEDNEQAAMLKLKDWPPEAHFSERLPRHNQARPCQCIPANPAQHRISPDR